MNIKLDPELKAQIKRSSLRAASVSAIGAIFAFGAMIYGAYELQSLNTKVVVQKKQVDSSAQLANQYKAQVNSLEKALDFTTAAVDELHRHNYAEAVTNYDRALAYNPNDPDILNLKGYALFKLHKYDQAAAALNQSILLDLSNPWSELNLAKVQCANHKYADAKSAITFIIVNQPDFVDTVLGDGEFTHVCNPIMKWVLKEVDESEKAESHDHHGSGVP